MKPRSWFRTSLLVLIALLTLISVSSTLAVPPQQTFTASLTPVAGLIQRLPVGRSEWITITQPTQVNIGDQIRTGNDGLARLNAATGIEVEIYPTTQVVLNDLATGETTDTKFILYQLVGMTLTKVTQPVDNADQIQVITPPANVSLRGTEFITWVSPNLNTAVFSNNGTVQVDVADGTSYQITPEDIIYISVELATPLPVCTADYLAENSHATPVIRVIRNDTEFLALKDSLINFLTSNVNPDSRTSMRELLGLDGVSLDSVDENADEAELQELLQTLQNLDNREHLQLSMTLSKIRSYLQTYVDNLGTSVAPQTCGNGVQDTGETAETCAEDVVDVTASCGNNLCETNRLDIKESLINCPADCLPQGDFGLSCADAMRGQGRPPTRTPEPSPTPRGTF